MKVVLDATVAQFNNTGTAHYINNLKKHLVAGEEQLKLVTLYGPNRIRRLGWLGKILNLILEVIWIQLLLPINCLIRRADLLHVPANIGPYFAPCPVVVSIHDITFLKYKSLYDPAYALYARMFVKLSARRSKMILSPSNATTKDLKTAYKVPDMKIKTIYYGMHNFLPNAEAKKLAKEYLLYVGAIDSHKNLIRLIDAYSSSEFLRDRFYLVLAGSKGTAWEQIVHYVQSEGLKGSVHLTGRLTDDELASWYVGAKAFILPSLNEGFGFPLVEAMAYGLPVFCSNVGSIPEIVSSAGRKFNPFDTNEIKDMLETHLRDESNLLGMRHRSLERALDFTWASTADKTLSVYKGIVSGDYNG